MYSASGQIYFKYIRGLQPRTRFKDKYSQIHIYLVSGLWPKMVNPYFPSRTTALSPRPSTPLPPPSPRPALCSPLSFSFLLASSLFSVAFSSTFSLLAHPCSSFVIPHFLYDIYVLFSPLSTCRREGIDGIFVPPTPTSFSLSCIAYFLSSSLNLCCCSLIFSSPLPSSSLCPSVSSPSRSLPLSLSSASPSLLCLRLFPPMRAATRLSQALLYAPGAFFTHPLKPLLFWLLGERYSLGYAHFRRDHSAPTNLRLHLACAALQLGANFALLHELDDKIGGGRLLSTLAAGGWSLCQLLSPAPAAPKLLAAIAIGAAHACADALRPDHTTEIATCAMMMLAMWPTRTSTGVQPTLSSFALRSLPTLLVFFGVWMSLERALSHYAAGRLVQQRVWVNGGLLSLIFCASLRTRPVTVSTIIGACAGRVAHVLTGEPHLYFFSMAFFAMGCQGLSHTLSGQPVIAHSWRRARLPPNSLSLSTCIFQLTLATPPTGHLASTAKRVGPRPQGGL